MSKWGTIQKSGGVIDTQKSDAEEKSLGVFHNQLPKEFIMARPRKTIAIAELVAIVNRRNQHSTCTPDIRKGWNSLLEEVLAMTDNGDGFSYLKEGEVPFEKDPGIRIDKEGKFTWENTDNSRVHYYNLP
jgi:hypothetical protein